MDMQDIIGSLSAIVFFVSLVVLVVARLWIKRKRDEERGRVMHKFSERTKYLRPFDPR